MACCSFTPTDTPGASGEGWSLMGCPSCQAIVASGFAGQRGLTITVVSTRDSAMLSHSQRMLLVLGENHRRKG